MAKVQKGVPAIKRDAADEIKALREDLFPQFTKRNQLIAEYVKLRELFDPREGSAYKHGVTNFPQVVCNLGIHALANAEINIRIPIANEKADEKDKFSKAERALWGIDHVVDEQYRHVGDTVGRRRANSDDLVSKGSFFNLALVLPSELGGDGAADPEFLADRWDPETCYPGYGNYRHGMKHFIHEYKCPIYEYEDKRDDLGLEKIDLPRGTKDVKVTQYFKRVKEGNDWVVLDAIMCEDRIVRDFDYVTGKKGLVREIPVYGGSAIRGGIGFLDAIRKPVEYHNYIFSTSMEAARRQIKQLVAITTDRTTHILDLQEFTKNDTTIVDLLPEENIQSVEVIKGFAEFTSLMAIPTGEMQRATIPHAAWGDPNVSSGYLNKQLQEAAMVNLGPYFDFLNRTHGDIYRIWLKMFKEGPYKPIGIAARNSPHYDGLYHETFSPEDVPDFLYVETDGKMAMPDDLMDKLTAANMAAPGKQVMAVETVADRILGLQDPRLETEKIRKEQAETMLIPSNGWKAAKEEEARLKAAADRKRAEGNHIEGEELAQEAKMVSIQAELIFNQLMQQQGQPQQPPGQSGSVISNLNRPNQGGLSPAQGGLNNAPMDRIKGQAGIPPPSPNRTKNAAVRAGVDTVMPRRSPNAR